MFGAIGVARPNNTKDSDNCIYSGWGIGFDHTGTFNHPEGDIARNVIISGAFVYFYWYKNKQLDLKKDVPDVEYSKAETLMY